MPRISIPGHGETTDLSYDPNTLNGNSQNSTVGRYLMLASKYRAAQMNIERMKVEKDALEFELRLYQQDIQNAISAQVGVEDCPTKLCSFCKNEIREKALVCKNCMRAQPFAYDDIAAKDSEISKAVAAADIRGYSISQFPPNACAYCRVTLRTDATVCSCCKRLQPRCVAEVAREDIAALKIRQLKDKSS